MGYWEIGDYSLSEKELEELRIEREHKHALCEKVIGEIKFSHSFYSLEIEGGLIVLKDNRNNVLLSFEGETLSKESLEKAIVDLESCDCVGDW
jgi:hypothetical protein